MTSHTARVSEGSRDDDGFTLVELVISVAIVAIISVALCGVVLSYLRTTVETQARLTESHDVQFAAAYWQRDVASIGVRLDSYDDTTHSFALKQSVAVPQSADLPACAGLPAGATAVVTLGWSEYTSTVSTVSPALIRVTYAAKPVSSGLFELFRVRCGSQASTVRVADSLSAEPTVTCSTDCAGAGANVPARVALSMSVHDPSAQGLPVLEATLSGERRQT